MMLRPGLRHSRLALRWEKWIRGTWPIIQRRSISRWQCCCAWERRDWDQRGEGGVTGRVWDWLHGFPGLSAMAGEGG
ncbi:hypothetical protein PF005_g299 [Phytophthora fragariae]|uniref:Uncharacterized protein n=1 Tax=Phytophthora fragariae TaxID=53985 RepID=A0A6A3G0X3_9STRA|nr:hypothetical protein PF009_g247 [Phytophthora fragariae]KAE9154365.1 hypothetical protein PF006_g1586 [Phytophthora fragariae]KAE9238316.1 hypothetical protein PF005_g299 [Phytophthora fragariae]